MLFRPDPDRSSVTPESTTPQAQPPSASGVCRALTSLLPGDLGKLCRVETGNATQQRLYDLGFVRGTQVKFVRAAPLGDPLEIQVRGTRLCLRKAEARLIWVHPVGADP